MFDRKKFFGAWKYEGPTSIAVADEIEKLHAEIAALKARLPASPELETGWAVMDEDGMIFTVGHGFAEQRDLGWVGRWAPILFPAREAAEVLVSALCTGRAAKLNKKTLEEVGE